VFIYRKISLYWQAAGDGSWLSPNTVVAPVSCLIGAWVIYEMLVETNFSNFPSSHSAPAFGSGSGHADSLILAALSVPDRKSGLRFRQDNYPDVVHELEQTACKGHNQASSITNLPL
jgi:hypothetical protein